MFLWRAVNSASYPSAILITTPKDWHLYDNIIDNSKIYEMKVYILEWLNKYIDIIEHSVAIKC